MVDPLYTNVVGYVAQLVCLTGVRITVNVFLDQFFCNHSVWLVSQQLQDGCMHIARCLLLDGSTAQCVKFHSAVKVGGPTFKKNTGDPHNNVR